MSLVSAPAGQQKTSCLSNLTHDPTSEQTAQDQDEVASPLTYQQALDGLRNDGSLFDPEVTSLLDELVTREKSYGENNIFVAYVLKRIVQRCNFIGKHKEAETLSRRALEIFEAVGGEDHLIVAEQLKDLGFSCQSQEKYDVAEPSYQRAIAIFKTKLAPDDFKIANVKLSLGSCCFRQDKYKEAEVLYKQALEIYELKLGPDHDMVTSARGLLYCCKKQAEKLEKMKQSTAHKRTFDAINTDTISTHSEGLVGAAKTAKIVNAVDPRATTSSAAFAVTSTPMLSSSSDEAVPRESRSLKQVRAELQAGILAVVNEQLSDRFITEIDESIHWNLKKRIDELQIKNADQNGELCRASRKIEDLMCSLPTYERLIAEQQAYLDERARQLNSSEEKIKNLERSRQATLSKSVRLEVEIYDKNQLLSEAKATIETAERTIAELKAEINEKSSKLTEAHQTIESRLSCSICKDEDANRMWSRCHHVATCQKCAMELLRRVIGKFVDGVACPKCRTRGYPLEVYI